MGSLLRHYQALPQGMLDAAPGQLAELLAAADWIERRRGAESLAEAAGRALAEHLELGPTCARS